MNTRVNSEHDRRAKSDGLEGGPGLDRWADKMDEYLGDAGLGATRDEHDGGGSSEKGAMLEREGEGLPAT